MNIIDSGYIFVAFLIITIVYTRYVFESKLPSMKDNHIIYEQSRCNSILYLLNLLMGCILWLIVLFG